MTPSSSLHIQNPYAARQEARSLVAIAWPSILTGFGWMAMGLVDTVMVGRLGAVELGAVALANSLYFTAFVTMIGLTHASSPLISQSLGRRDEARVGLIMSQALLIGLTLSPLLAWAFLNGGGLLAATGQAPEVTEAAGTYLAARALAVVPHVVFSVHRSLLDGVGRTNRLLRLVVAANVVNFLANNVFIFGVGPFSGWGVAGAGYATSVSILALLAGAVREVRRPEYAVYGLRVRRPDWGVLRELLRLGAPMSATFAAEMSVFAVIGLCVGWLGTEALSAHQVVWSLLSLSFVVSGGLATATSVRVGAAFGRDDQAGIEVAGRVALILTTFAMAAIGTLYLWVPEALAGVYTDDVSVQARVAGLAGLAVAVVLFDGLQVVASHGLRATSDSHTAFWANLVAHWGVGLPVGYLLAFEYGWGLYGFWAGIALAFSVVGVWLTRVFLNREALATA